MAEVLSRAEATAMLQAIGFDNARRAFDVAVTGFQSGWNLGDPLKVDSRFGKNTSTALALSYARHRRGLSTLSANFSFVEFRCKDDGAFPECRRIWVQRTHVRRLEAYRVRVGGAVRIVSGCRCKRRNRAVGGATSSQHMYGVASDVQALLTVEQKEEARIFAGLGFQQSTRKVVHVDSRDLGGHNLTHGSPTAPTEWRYAT